jgi:hypothetical protein
MLYDGGVWKLRSCFSRDRACHSTDSCHAGFASQSNATCRTELWVATRWFSVMEYKYFHDIMVEEFNSFNENASCSVPLETYHGTIHWRSQNHSTLTDGSDELAQSCGFCFPLLLILQVWDRKKLVEDSCNETNAGTHRFETRPLNTSMQNGANTPSLFTYCTFTVRGS